MDVLDCEVKYGGKGYMFHIAVNTGEDPAEIAKRISAVLRCACCIQVSELTTDEVTQFMRLVADAARENAKSG
jgi:hypothetical protein